MGGKGEVGYKFQSFNYTGGIGLGDQLYSKVITVDGKVLYISKLLKC